MTSLIPTIINLSYVCNLCSLASRKSTRKWESASSQNLQGWTLRTLITFAHHARRTVHMLNRTNLNSTLPKMKLKTSIKLKPFLQSNKIGEKYINQILSNNLLTLISLKSSVAKLLSCKPKRTQWLWQATTKTSMPSGSMELLGTRMRRPWRILVKIHQWKVG